MPHPTRGLFLARRYSSEKGVHHFGILDVGNHLGYEAAREPVMIHMVSPHVRAEWFSTTGHWDMFEPITDVPGAVARLQQALGLPCYDLVFNNCEHFARYVATGVRESRQVKEVLTLAGVVGIVAFAMTRKAA